MSTSKFKLNLDKTEFIVFGLKRQRDKLKAYFPTNSNSNSTFIALNLCQKRYDFNFDLKEASEFAEQTSSGRSFQIIGAS